MKTRIDLWTWLGVGIMLASTYATLLFLFWLWERLPISWFLLFTN